MPTIPTYLDTQNRVALDPEFQKGLTVTADPDAFGAGIGRSMQSVARGLGAISDAATQLQDMKDHAVVSDALNQYSRKKDDLLYNPDNGYSTLEGKAAVDGYDAFKKKVETLKTTVGANLTPAQARLFGQRADGLEADTLRTGMIKNAAETKSYLLQEHAASADLFSQQAAQQPLDSARWESMVGRGIDEINASGAKQGWGPEKLDAARKEYISNARVAATQTLALSDPIAAAKYATDHAEEISGQQRLALLETLKPHIADAVNRDAQKFSASKPAPNQFAAAGLPHDTYALLSVISGSESPGYNLMNGGQTIADLARHPGFIGQGGTTTASGRYQFIKETWNTAAKALGITDFSPASQDRAAAWVAARDYRTNSHGRDLAQDIAAGNYAIIRANLATTWEGLAKMSDAKFATLMQQARSAPMVVGDAEIPPGTVGPIPAGQGGSGAPASAPAGTSVQFSPAVSAVLDGLPAAYAADIRTAADNGMRAYNAQQTAAQNAIKVAQSDNYKLRIANGDTSLTAGDINDDTVLDNGDKAVLISALKESQKGVLETAADVSAFQAGNLVLDAYSEKDKKRGDNVFAASAANAAPEQRVPLLVSHVAQTGMVPTRVANAMRFDMSTGTTANMVRAMQLAATISQADPGALLRATGGSEIADDLATWKHLVGDMGVDPAVAARQLIDAKDPAKVKANAALMESKPMKDKVKAQATAANVAAIFDPGVFSAAPKLGQSDAQSAAIVSDYGEFLNQAILEKGDYDQGIKLANDRFKRIYGTSEYTMGGSKVITRLPPEKTYVSDPNGSWGYIGEQMKASLKADGIDGKNSFLVADADTQADVSAGKPPRYQLWYTDENGVHQQYRRPFRATPPTKEEIDKVKAADTAKKNEENAAKQVENQKEQKELDARRDSELDDFLAGPPKLNTPHVKYKD